MGRHLGISGTGLRHQWGGRIDCTRTRTLAQPGSPGPATLPELASGHARPCAGGGDTSGDVPPWHVRDHADTRNPMAANPSRIRRPSQAVWGIGTTRPLDVHINHHASRCAIRMRRSDDVFLGAGGRYRARANLLAQRSRRLQSGNVRAPMAAAIQPDVSVVL